MNNPFEVIEARLSSIEDLILDLKHQPTTSKKVNGRLSISDVSDMTGYTVATLYSKVHKRKIPFHKSPNGSKLVFYEDEIRKWLEGNIPPTPEERAAEKLQKFNEGRAAKC